MTLTQSILGGLMELGFRAVGVMGPRKILWPRAPQSHNPALHRISSFAIIFNRATLDIALYPHGRFLTPRVCTRPP